MAAQHHAHGSITLSYADPRQNRRDHSDGTRPGFSRRHSGLSGGSLANEALGWFSIGLGLAEIAAPRLLTRVIGVPGDHRLLLRLLGFREIASGLGLLSRRRPAFWMQSRVWGDMMDLVVLSAALIVPRTDRGKLLAATAAVAGVTWLDVLSSRRSDHEQAPGQGPIHVIKTVTVNRSAEDLYRFWRDFHNLPTVIPHLEAVHVMSETRSHWIAKAPGGITIEWDAEIVEDQHGHTIQWRSLESGDLPNEGRVRFTRATGDRGTVVRVELQYDPPAGRVGWLAARLLGRDPGEQLQEGLRRFKQRMEAGEIATTHGQPAGHEGGLAMVRR